MAQTPPEKQSDKQVRDNQVQGPPRRNWAASIARDAGGTAAAAFVRAGFTDPALVLHWSDIAGAEVARIARPVRFSARDGILTLLAEPAAALFLAHESRALVTRINTYLGQATISKIKFVQGRLSMPPALPTPPRPAKNINLSDPSNSYNGPAAVKSALQSLARWRQAGPSGGG